MTGVGECGGDMTGEGNVGHPSSWKATDGMSSSAKGHGMQSI